MSSNMPNLFFKFYQLSNRLTFLAVFCSFAAALVCAGSPEVVFAVNCGGDEFVDSNDIHYQADPLADPSKSSAGEIGTASDFGRQLEIRRISTADQPLYQTERYHHSTFGYDFPPLSDGDYVLVLKFSEVYFDSPDEKVFDVVLNGEHTVVQDLDIYARVGRGVAHDELVPFSVKAGHVIYQGDTSDIEQGVIRVDFVKGYRDNPKVNAILLLRAQLEDAPRLPDLPPSDDYDDEDYPEHDEHGQPTTASEVRRAPPSGPVVKDPYGQEDSGPLTMLPVFITIGASVPLLICTCRL